MKKNKNADGGFALITIAIAVAVVLGVGGTATYVATDGFSDFGNEGDSETKAAPATDYNSTRSNRNAGIRSEGNDTSDTGTTTETEIHMNTEMRARSGDNSMYESKKMESQNALYESSN